LRAVRTNAGFFNTSTNFSCVKMWGPGSAHYCIAPSSRVSLVSTDINSSVQANLIFSQISAWVFEAFQIRRTSGSVYSNTLEELSGFREEPVVIWLILILFVDHGLYIEKKWAFDMSENCDDEPSNPPWYPAGVCAVYNTMVYIPSES
jgi:hypothetical protein